MENYAAIYSGQKNNKSTARRDFFQPVTSHFRVVGGRRVEGARGGGGVWFKK